MLCNRCKKREARIYYTEFTKGQKKEEYLCEECAAQYTSFQGNGQNLGGFLSSILSSYYGEQLESQEKETEDINCPVCGMSLEQFTKAGKAGCSNCYKVFGKSLEKVVKQMQGADTHKGKRPGNLAAQMEKTLDTISQVEKLGILLQEAIEKEEFEEAARLRDEIRALKKEEAAKKAEEEKAVSKEEAQEEVCDKEA